MAAAAKPEAFIGSLLARYRDPDACLAEHLCDAHDPASLAYRILSPDLAARDLTYGDLREASERFAAALAGLGVKPGDRVATLMDKTPEYLAALIGIWRLGAVHVPLFTAFAPPAIGLRLAASHARVVVCDAGQQDKLRPGDDMPAQAPWQVITTGEPSARALSFDELMAQAAGGFPAVKGGGRAPMIHIFTSGTTGRPKGVVVPTAALAAFHAYARFGLDLRSDDVYWCAADPGWAYGLYFGVLCSLVTGTPSLLLEGGFSAENTVRVLADQSVTNFAAAPTVYRALQAADLSIPGHLRLRCATSAGEPLTPEVNEWAVGALGLPVHDHYGQSEAGMLINNHHHPLLRRSLKAGSMGQAMPGWRAIVLHANEDREVGPGEVGRVAMVLEDSPLAWFDGYDGEAELSAEKFAGGGRWYLTGDVGRIDEAGYFYFSARDDDVIISAGYRIGPFDVEAALTLHAAVAECAVIAVPDALRGEVIEAFVVLRAGHAGGDALARELQEWVKARYAAHAYPRRVHFADSLPKTPSGKVQRFVLKQERIAAIEGAAAGPGR